VARRLIWAIPGKGKNMKKPIAITLMLFVTVFFVSGCTSSFSQWMGKPSPDFTVTDIDGRTFNLSQQRGKDVIVVISTTWCPFCKAEVPELIRLRDSFDADSVTIIAISNEDAAVLRKFRQERGINYMMASTANLPSPYSEMTGLPRFFFIDRNGTIRDTTSGYHSFESLKNLVSAMGVPAMPAK
jgi:peroxiredoxin